MKTATANLASSGLGIRKYQSGVALLQVLLLSTIITVLAIGFTKTAREQIRMAEAIEGRVLGQLRTDSILNEIVFSQLAYQVYPQATIGDSDLGAFIERKKSLNFFGKPILWGSDSVVRIQDLNGLLPQTYPQHFAWTKLLPRLGLTESETVEYLGVWKDVQDPDLRSWVPGVREPFALPSGMPYINGFSQSDQVLRSVLDGKPDIAGKILDFSSIYSPYKMNFLNAPKPLLIELLGESLGASLSDSRESGADEAVLTSMLPPGFLAEVESVGSYKSTYQRIDISHTSSDAGWSKSVTIHISPSSTTPFSILSNN